MREKEIERVREKHPPRAMCEQVLCHLQMEDRHGVLTLSGTGRWFMNGGGV